MYQQNHFSTFAIINQLAYLFSLPKFAKNVNLKAAHIHSFEVCDDQVNIAMEKAATTAVGRQTFSSDRVIYSNSNYGCDFEFF